MPANNNAVVLPFKVPGVTVTSASLDLFARYFDVLAAASAVGAVPAGCDIAHLQWMCVTATAQGPSWPVDKLSRWLGFVQGVMTMQGLLTVDEERQRSRPLFHAAYLAADLDRPASVAPTVTSGAPSHQTQNNESLPA